MGKSILKYTADVSALLSSIAADREKKQSCTCKLNMTCYYLHFTIKIIYILQSSRWTNKHSIEKPSCI